MAEHSPEFWNAKAKWMRANRRVVPAEEREAARHEWQKQQRLELLDKLKSLDEQTQVSG